MFDYYEPADEDCELIFDIGAGKVADIEEIRLFPRDNFDTELYDGTEIEVSNDGSTWTSLYSLENTNDGWNIWSDEAATHQYRYIRIAPSDEDGGRCDFAEIQIYGHELTDITDDPSGGDIDCGATVYVNDATPVNVAGTAVTYQESKTATLQSINPNMGTSQGGETVTFTLSELTGFVSGDVTVEIDGVDCGSVSVNQPGGSTEISCTTGAAPAIDVRRNSLESRVIIHIEDHGYVYVPLEMTYFYVDRWSDELTWGNISPPREGDSVHIPSGQVILLDVSPPKLNALVIEGALIFADEADITLDAHYIMINYGRFQVGTENNRFQHKATITLHGTKEDPHLPRFGNKVIANNKGIIDLHGEEVDTTWTLLGSTADIGDTVIELNEIVTWPDGGHIIIASTDHDHYFSEERYIVSSAVVGGKTQLTLDSALEYEHISVEQTISINGGESKTIEMRAEVGLLTRNVII
mmetsp:Transcript_27798/g.24415  ORF Transcript_27798/g.24415 Transcript_27798/m.24415 type:complete len:468 (+) Transcript_27798:561-1964(+)